MIAFVLFFKTVSHKTNTAAVKYERQFFVSFIDDKSFLF